MDAFARCTEGFVSGSHPLGSLVVILSLTHLGAGNSHSLRLLGGRENWWECIHGGKVWWQPSVGQVLLTPDFCLIVVQRVGPEDSGILCGDPWPGHMALGPP